MAVILGKPAAPRKPKSLEEILAAERARKAGKPAETKPVAILGTVECSYCGNIKKNAEPKEYYCTYCDEPTFHRLIA